MFQNLFTKVSKHIEYTIYNTFENYLPDTLSSNELYLITGSNASVYENREWIISLLNFIRTAHSQKVPLVGICFGHQAIAQALGGQVIRSPKGWGTGIRESLVNTQTALRYFPESKMLLHYNHHDQVVRLPAQAVNFATSDFCEFEGFTIDNYILTFQGHPEYTDFYNRHLLTHHSAEEPEEIKRKGLESIENNEAMGMKVAQWILDFSEKRGITPAHLFSHFM